MQVWLAFVLFLNYSVLCQLQVENYAIVNNNPTKRILKQPEVASLSESVQGFSPLEIKSFYSFDTSPNAESHLQTFSTKFNLPQCTSMNGCFTKVGQDGSGRIATGDTSWYTQIALDVEWVHAMAPSANIMLVLANSTSQSDLFEAVNYVKYHAQYINMGFGTPDYTGMTSNDYLFFQLGVSFFAASGNSGTQTQYPSSSSNVIAVGGTSLYVDTYGNFSSEVGWSFSGGGCSQYETATSQQRNDVRVILGSNAIPCSNFRRKVPDLSSVADPLTGVSVFSENKWIVVGGTSVASAITTGRAAASGVTITSRYLYTGGMYFRDIVTGGTDTTSCSVGWDYVTGLGSWYRQELTNVVNNTLVTPAPTPTPTPTPGPTPGPTIHRNTTSSAPVTTYAPSKRPSQDIINEIERLLQSMSPASTIKVGTSGLVVCFVVFL
ncbi:hypothetical protein AKO1_008880, partial [Acrasis kona]